MMKRVLCCAALLWIAQATGQNRPQEPRPPFPYAEEQVSVPSGENTLAATLTLPKRAVKKVAVLVTGSGPQNRDEELFGHRPFAVLADYLARRGIAVIRYDDRGVGQSTGDYAAASLQDFARDARAVASFAHTRFPEAKVGVIGHSEGGAVALMVDDLDFLVSLAGPGVSGRALLARQQEDFIRASATPDIYAKPYLELMQKAMAEAVSDKTTEELKTTLAELLKDTMLAPQTDVVAAQLSSPAMRSFLRFDPAQYDIHIPALALNGEKDMQVAAEPNLAGWRAKGAQTVLLPGLNHLFQTSLTGLPTEYGAIEETFSPKALKMIGDWILKL